MRKNDDPPLDVRQERVGRMGSVGLEHGHELLGAHGPTKMEALALPTVEALKEWELLLCLDSLGDNPLASA